MFILELKIIPKTNIFAKIQPDGKNENFTSVFLHRQISTISFTLLTLPILNIIEKLFSLPKTKLSKIIYLYLSSYMTTQQSYFPIKIQLRKIIFSLIFYKDYYNLYAKYIQKSIENLDPYQIPFIGNPSFSSLANSYEIIFNTGKFDWD